MASLCMYRHKAEKIISGRISNAKVICIIELELMELMSNRIATRTNSSKSMPSNALRILLLYGLMERCIRRIAAQLVMSKYRDVKSLDENTMVIVIITIRQIM